jgi:hypothetical protein
MWSMDISSRESLDSSGKQKHFLGYNYKPLNQVRSLIPILHHVDENDSQALGG